MQFKFGAMIANLFEICAKCTLFAVKRPKKDAPLQCDASHVAKVCICMCKYASSFIYLYAFLSCFCFWRNRCACQLSRRCALSINTAPYLPQMQFIDISCCFTFIHLLLLFTTIFSVASFSTQIWRCHLNQPCT